MTQLKGFKFLATMVLVFKKTENDNKTKYDNFYSSSKTEIIVNEVILMMCFNQSILQLSQKEENL